MANWVPLKEVLASPCKYGDISEIPIDYTPDYGKITLSGEETGMSIPQKFETEMNNVWHATMHNGRVYLVSRGVTEQELRLRGKTGYENGKQIQRKIASLFGNAMLGATGEIWTKDTIDMATKTLPEFLRKVKEWHWTGIEYQYPDISGYCAFGLQLVDSGTLYGNYSSVGGSLYDSSGNSNTSAASVRPLVHLPSDILIDTSELGMGVSLTLMTPNIARTHNEQREMIIPSKSYIITEEELKALEDLESCHREKADAILDLIKKIRQN